MTKKKMLSILTSMVCTAGIGWVVKPLTADAETCSDAMQYGDYIYYEKIDEDEDGLYDYVVIAGCDESAIEIEIPGEIENLPVKSIGIWAFVQCKSLESINVSENNKYYSSINGVLFNKDKTELVRYPIGSTNTAYTVPNGVMSIAENAFEYCTNLSGITLPDSVTLIGVSAFKNCESLMNINIPKSVTSIGGGAFDYCSVLAKINVSESNEYYSSLGGVLFNKNKTELIRYLLGNMNTKYTIPDSVESIGYGSFQGNSKLTGVTIPDSVTSIDDWAFAECPNLTNITIPGMVTSIGYCVFYGCTNLKSITISDSVESIEEGAFEHCTSIESITIPDSVTSIGNWAFYDCSSLKNLNIPDSIISIEFHTFDSCTSLESITIPDNVTLIEGGAFEDCKSLTSVTIENPKCEIYDSKDTFCNGDNENDEPFFNGTICGYTNSTAQAYAEKYGYKFESKGVYTPEVLKGDANGDGEISVSDIVIIQKCLVKADDMIDFNLLDINNDSKVNVFDLILVKRIVINF